MENDVVMVTKGLNGVKRVVLGNMVQIKAGCDSHACLSVFIIFGFTVTVRDLATAISGHKIIYDRSACFVTNA